MNKTKPVAHMLAIAATLGTAHAAQVMDASCADVNNRTFSETSSRQPVICANGKGQHAKTVPVASVDITKYSAAKKFEASYAADSFVGTRNIQQNSDGHGQFTLVATPQWLRGLALDRQAVLCAIVVGRNLGRSIHRHDYVNVLPGCRSRPQP